MCGILFLYKPSREPAEEVEDRLTRALGLMTHRGPDGSGLYCKAPVAIGHRRLAIIDINQSKQPMSDPGGRYIISYNGEVYNYKELRKSLEAHWTFRTAGDTEVVLAGLAIHGPAFLARMEGM